MKKPPNPKRVTKPASELKSEYSFDYSKAKPNRFTKSTGRTSLAVQLDPDVAAVFRDASTVNNVLRALVGTMPRVRR